MRKLNYTINPDKDWLRIARRSYVDFNDPTGYKWSIECLVGGWDTWMDLIETQPGFPELVGRWNNEIFNKLKSTSLSIIQDIAANGQPAQQIVAAKYLANREYDPSTNNRGRPTREEISGKLAEAIKIDKSTADDIERIGLKVIHGGKTVQG